MVALLLELEFTKRWLLQTGIYGIQCDLDYHKVGILVDDNITAGRFSYFLKL